jgi:hypothetical protein
MSGLRRITQHPDRIRDPHARARELLSDALLGPLDELDAVWLDEHLAHCAPCAADGEAFAADAAMLHDLRGDLPAVPRDLGARVSLALDDEVRRALRGRRPAGLSGGRAGRPGRRSAWTGGAFAGLAVAALIAILVLPLGILPGTPATTQPPGMSVAPEATPITVDTQPVAWVRKTTAGTYVISSAEVDRVCPGVDATSCGTLDGTAETVASLDLKPSSLLLPRDGNPAVVVGNEAVYAVSLDKPAPVTSPEPGTSPLPTSEPAQSPAVTGEPATPPADSPAPSATLPSPEPSATTPPPEATPEVTPEATPEAGTATPAPSDAGSPTPAPTSGVAGGDTTAETPSPSAESTPTASPGPVETATPAPPTPLPTMPPATPAPTASAIRAIAERVIIVGALPAYSPDGKWVAFSARPADGSHGPDIYAWRVGDRRARVLTDDHGSIFAGWSDGLILASSARLADAVETKADALPAADADPTMVVARSFMVDPARKTVTEIARDGIWLPVVDSTGRVVVYWSGSLGWSATARTWLPAAGRLLVADWHRVLDPDRDVAARMLPATATALGIADFEVRFDPAGRRLAVWTGDPENPGAGHIALVTVNDDGSLGKVLLADAAALPGFSLDADRLAWSTPPGRNGEGSHVTVYAWRGENAGQVYSIPDSGDEPLVVGR